MNETGEWVTTYAEELPSKSRRADRVASRLAIRDGDEQSCQIYL